MTTLTYTPIDLSQLQSIVTHHFGDFSYYEIVASEADIRASQLILDESLYPSPAPRSYRDNARQKCSRLGDGRLRLKINVDAVAERDAGFRRFIGSLLADTRLSLVKGESNV